MLEPIARCSSRVAIVLLVGGLELAVSQVTNSLLFLRETADVEVVDDAELVIQIDDRVIREIIVLTSPIRRGDKTVAYL